MKSWLNIFPSYHMENQGLCSKPTELPPRQRNTKSTANELKDAHRAGTTIGLPSHFTSVRPKNLDIKHNVSSVTVWWTN